MRGHHLVTILALVVTCSVAGCQSHPEISRTALQSPDGSSERAQDENRTPVAFAAISRKSTAKMTNNSQEQSSFCTVDGKISVVQNCLGQDANSGCSGGVALLEGPSTQRLDRGNFSIPAGCYTHKIASGSVWGNAVMTNTVNYNSKN
jgi:hypothetical protein